ncbi:histone acetyltransferase TRA1 KNAG_0C05130 [Huiozyma naganishii CBS 8797]|uniref:Non-specific serine/threonine protein kinase n=1 Tax=Huiozyma naganishii (strain ATCC MYA-139 / BCRC 22969 / CBS 8797 / KCTC 17520 / NBRC 10181 / NCYC 3082 / Yp74L-3) TaxID=1071383 RepID=J7S519_HUIN7|nr:hypothetical protein KNAG_0C05130 [Kazachstania naganishii CBS 8797]CCK69614.1 hypothetical protein KNAG_0C05130 [Kazachstania naganishii CBS 8797]
MSLTSRLDDFVAKFDDANLSFHDRLNTLLELQDFMDGKSNDDFEVFMNKMIPVLLQTLEKTPISFDKLSIEQKLRNSILELINNCFMNHLSETQMELVLNSLLSILPKENEDNGVLCMKILTILFKSFKNSLGEKVEDFIAIIIKFYENAHELVAREFTDANSTHSSPPDPGEEQSENLLDPDIVQSQFDPLKHDGEATERSDQGFSARVIKGSLRSSMFSFKILSECPITMVTLYSSYKQLTRTSIQQFTPYIFNLLKLEVEQQKNAREEAESRGVIYVDVSPEIRDRSIYCDFILTQIKATSFLAYVFIRSYAAEFLQNNAEFVPDVIIRLLQDCPPELSSARKELLHAIRHILSTNYKMLFLPKLKYLFNEDVLVGKGFTTYHTLRPLAYSTLADFVHNTRTELRLDDIEKTVRMYTEFLLDDSLAYTVQIMCGKLLLNLVERILKLGKENPQEASRAKKLLMIIINSYTKRFKMLNMEYDKHMAQHEIYQKRKLEKSKGAKMEIEIEDIGPDVFMEKTFQFKHIEQLPPSEELSGTEKKEEVSKDSKKDESNQGVYVDMFNLDEYAPIRMTPVSNSDPIKDAFYVYRTLMSFLKTIVHDVKVFNPPPNEFTVAHAKQWAGLSRVFSYEEVVMFRNLFHECVIGLKFFANENIKLNALNKKHFDVSSPTLPIAASKDGRELMEYLAFMFIQIDSSTFDEIIESEIGFLYKSMLKDSALLHVAQSFLTTEVTSPNFASILLRFLNTKLKNLGNVDFVESNVLIRLFKLAFMSVNLFPNTNEMVLLPYLNDLILDSLKFSTEAEEPLAYFYLIRTLFRSIGGGRFENLYRSIKPILQVLLQTLNEMILTARLPQERELYVELCITVPVRLSVLAPYLPYLMKPLVFALQGYPELISQGLRTLELCVDNLTAEYFDPIIEPVVDDVIKSLFKLLQPQPYNHTISHTVVKILGKLGGRNRRFLKPPTDLETEKALDYEIIAHFKAVGLDGEFPLSVTPGVRSAMDVLANYKVNVNYKKEAYRYLKNILLLFFKSSIKFSDNFDVLVRKVCEIQSLDKYEVKENFDVKSPIDREQFSEQEELFIKLLESVFLSCSIPELKEEATELLKHIIDHMCLLYINNSMMRKRNLCNLFNFDIQQPELVLDSVTIVETISSSLSCHIPEVQETAIYAIKRIHEKSKLIYGDELVFEHSLVYELMKHFMHNCYKEAFYEKKAGILGIKTLVFDIELSLDFLKKIQPDLVSAFSFVLKDAPMGTPSSLNKSAEELLLKVLRLTFEGVTENDLESKILHHSITDIVVELSNPNPQVRASCQTCLKAIHETTGIPIVKLMEKSKSFLLSPIFAKPLRALPFTMQIGNVDAITYCLGLPDSFLTFNEELFRLLQEVIVLADADDESLSTTQRVVEYKTSDQLVQLRISCIRLLALALKNEEFATAQQGNIRIRILAVFFKTMLKNSREIIDTTYEALKGALEENSKLPKELLQNGLKPMLMDLSDHQKLTVSGLYALSKLLELLIAYFKVEIGKKLLDHLNAWCRIEVMDSLFGKDINKQLPTEIITSIINIFHLLPPRADMFLNDLLLKIMLLERKLRIQLDSPFRVPLAKYLNRFHTSVTDYFKKNMALRQLVLFTCNIIKLPEAKDLADDFEKELGNFYNYYISNIPSNQVRVVSFFANMVDIFDTIAEIRGGAWLKGQIDMIFKLGDMLKITTQTVKSNAFCIDKLQLAQTIEKYQVLYLKHISFDADEQTQLLLQFIDFLILNDIKILPSVHLFIWENYTASSDTAKLNNFLELSLNFMLDNSSMHARFFILKYLIKPVLIYQGTEYKSLKHLTQEHGIPEWLKIIHTKIWKSSNAELLSNVSGKFDFYRFELLQISAVFVKWAPELITDIRKDIIKFNWNFIKLEDTLVKQSAYLTTALFIAKYDFPLNIVTQVFVALLRHPQTESRYLVKQSLDTLAPVIDKRMKVSGTPYEWVNWVKRVMFENKYNRNNTLYQFLVSHTELFYDTRHLFISNVINHMNRMTFAPNSNPEIQSLAIDLASMIATWEDKAFESRPSVKTDPDGDIEMAENFADTEEGSNNFSTVKDYTVPTQLREICVSFLIRYVCSIDHKASDDDLGLKALNILSNLLSSKHWSDVNIQLSYFEKFFSDTDVDSENAVYCCINTLDILYIFLNNKSTKWMVENLLTTESLLEKLIKINHHDIQEALVKILNIILKAIRIQGDFTQVTDNDTPSKHFINNLVSTVNQDLQGTASVTAGVTLVWTLFVNFSDAVDSLLNPIMKTFNKLCKDHLSTSQPKDAVTMEEAKITTKLLEKLLCLLSAKVSLLGDSRRPFLSTIALLIDRSMDQIFLRKIVSIARSWAFNTDIFPTIKEKSAILTKMLAFEVRGEPSLSKLFYEIVLELFEEKQYNNTEITVRMEQPFLSGTRTQNIDIRKRFMTILQGSLEKDIKERLYYVIRDQNWEFVSDYPWLNQATQLLYGTFDKAYVLSPKNLYDFSPPELLQSNLPLNVELTVDENADELKEYIINHQHSMETLCDIRASDILDPLVELFYQDSRAIENAWSDLFSQVYRCIPRNEKYGFVRSLITLLSKPYHSRQLNPKRNVITMLLNSISKIDNLEIPPHLVKYLAISYNSWYQAIKLLESIQDSNSIDNVKIIEANEEALLELYRNLQEDDIFYGLWRRRAKYNETNIGLSYEQVGLWDKAQQLYEIAQVKARSGALPYSESEYALWEDNWILCAEKLQQWDILTELAKHEGFTDLLLECGWRVADWHSDREALEQSVKSLMDVPTPRRQMFETFLALQNFADTGKGDQDVRRLCDEGIQLSLHKWISLPQRYTPAHKWLLHGFQQYLEFLEATHVYTNLHTTTAQNIDSKAQEVKRVFLAWRDRLPNIWDDIDLWNDLVTWRQHTFQVINNAYLPLVPTLQQNNSNNAINTHAYRGYHELAWIINRFAHVAREHDMPDVCISQLARIYTLPNIEIQEAFLKLREQAKCHYQNMNELTTGLDVISNTNLVYFNTGQKAEFFTLKGMFLSKLKAYDEANQAFATAVQIDLNLAKAWAQWGYFNDRRLVEEPNNISYASNAISCYLQAAGLYKNPKTRSLLCRILWLISMDDDAGSLTKAFESFRGEVPVWYWITFIPQLLTSLSHKEANMVRQILIRIAKSYPQALHFQLRTTREDFAVIQRRTMAVLADKKESTAASQPEGLRQPWEHLQELSNILKTAYPLLALSLESLVAQINERFKTTTDEDLFRLINVLLLDGTFNYNRLPLPRENSALPQNTETNLIRLSETLLDPHVKPKFNADFIESKPNFETYLKRLSYWRRRLENKLNRAPQIEYLERVCPNLSNFHHQKFEDIEIPGQYLMNHDNNAHFIKIARFLPAVNFVRGTHSSYRRLNLRGHDGSLHSFAVQSPAARHSRREERMFQLYRLLNKLLAKSVQTRRRDVQFTLPVAVPLSPQTRIMNDSASFTTLHQIYDEYCAKAGVSQDDIQDFISKELNTAHDKSLPTPDNTLVKIEIFSSIQSLYAPSTILKNYFSGIYREFEDFWLFRNQFASNYGTFTFLSYMMMINNRTPHKIHIDKSSGDVFTLEMLPSRYPFERVKTVLKNNELDLPADAPIFHNNEPVPFRLTPNIQKLIGDSGLEGIFSVVIFSIARALKEPENELNTYLTLFIRDEIISWYSNLHRPIVENPQLRQMVQSNVDLIIKRVAQLGHLSSNPAITTQFVLDLISSAVNPRNLAATDISYMAWF